jgi:hypothetical protein
MHLTITAFLLLALAPALSFHPTSLTCDSAHKLRVLFIGNSFTYVQNVPKQVEQIASALPGPCIETKMFTVGGASLEDHWRADSAAALIKAGNWTHVVLNDQSTFGEGWWLEGKPRIGTSGQELLDYGRRFTALIREKGAKPVIIAHWADASAPARDQRALDYLFAKFALETSSEVADVGYAVKRMQAEIPELDPYFTDKHHLSAAGAYLEALIIYATLTERSPVGAPRTILGPAVELKEGTVMDSVVSLVDLDERNAAAVQRLADTAYRNVPKRLALLTAPPALSAEFPHIPSGGDAVRRSDLDGNWRGTTTVLPNPVSDAIPMEISDDMLHVQAGALRFAGPVTIVVEGNQIVIRAPLMPPEGSTRSRPTPLQLELRGVKRGNRVEGLATIQQRFKDTTASFNAVGRFELQRP